MRVELLIAVVALQLVPIVGVYLWITSQARRSGGHGADFALAGRALPMPVVAATLALTVLGTPHIIGIFEMSWHVGATAVWFGLAHVILLSVVCLSTGIWARRLRLTTVAELLETLYSRNVRLAASCVMAGSIFGVLTLETQGLGIILSSMTGWDLRLCAALGGGLGVLYVVLAGMKEVGWLNLINASLMYVALVLATVFLALALPGGDFESVAAYYEAEDASHMLTILGPPDIIINFALALLLGLVFSMPINQVLLQTTMAAKSEQAVRNAIWLAAPLNGMFCVFTVVMGLTAKSLPEFHAEGPKLAAPLMLVELLPAWLTVFLLASFSAVVLSSFAMVSLGPSTIFAHDIYKRLYRPAASDAEIGRVIRITIIVLAIAAVSGATFLPPILASISWLLAWMVPIFWIVLVGLFWRRSAAAAGLTLGAAWATNLAWSLTPLPEWLGAAGMPNTYPVLAVTLLAGLGANLLFSGAPRYFNSADFHGRVAGGAAAE
ncbi:MAG: sodium:solute symporter family protein [Caulobacterales bacterium]|nr:sodium:solute symporter family protein [Caulobacterales bacterium]